MVHFHEFSVPTMGVVHLFTPQAFIAAFSVLCCMPGTGTPISPTCKGTIPMQSVGSRYALYVGSLKRDGP